MKRVVFVVCAASFAVALTFGIAYAGCDQTVDPTVRQTPVGTQVCGPAESPPPKPKPTTKPSQPSSHTPAPSHTQQKPTQARTATVSPSGTNTTALNLPNNFPQSQNYDIPPPPPQNDFGNPYLNNYYGSFGPKPKKGGDTYWLKVFLTLGLAGTGTVWLRRARVRGSMIGLPEN